MYNINKYNQSLTLVSINNTLYYLVVCHIVTNKRCNYGFTILLFLIKLLINNFKNVCTCIVNRIKRRI